MSIHTYGIHEQFAIKEKNKESLSSVVNNKVSLIIDCPSHTYKSLANDKHIKTQSALTNIDYQFITHLDSDHIGGLDNILWAKKFGENTKLNLITHPEIYEGLWERLKGSFGQDRTSDSKKEMYLENYSTLIPLNYSDEITIPGFGRIRSFHRATHHSVGMEMLAIQVFDESGKNIANFSGDTAIDSELIEFLSEHGGPIIHEVGSYSEGSFSHTSINELIEAAPENIHNRIWVNHIPEIKEHEIKKIITETGSQIRLADDLYSKSINKKLNLNNYEQKPVVFPGSFDPWTYGHEAVVTEYISANPYGKVCIVIGVNSEKKGTFSPEEKKILIEKSLDENLKNNIEIVIYKGVMADYVYENSFSGVIKGIRNSQDYDYEKELASASKKFSGDITTLLIPQTDGNKSGISSSSLKALSKFGGEIYSEASPIVREALRMKQTGQLIIGLTGGIASGKSTLGKALVQTSKNESISVHYINMDEITHDIHTRTDLDVFQKTRDIIASEFGKNILLDDGTSNKKVLGSMVFQDKNKLDALGNILLEPLTHFLRKKILDITTPGIILVEGAIIFERNLTYMFDENIINISINEKTQKERVKQRDGFNELQIKNRISNQLTTDERIKGIQEIQNQYSDRFFLDIDGEMYDEKVIYKKLSNAYNNRKEFNFTKKS